MAPRKYEFGHQKLKKKKRIEKLIESQKGAQNLLSVINKISQKNWVIVQQMNKKFILKS